MWIDGAKRPGWEVDEWVVDERTGLGACHMTRDGKAVGRIVERLDGYQAVLWSESTSGWPRVFGPVLPYRQSAIEWAFHRLTQG